MNHYPHVYPNLETLKKREETDCHRLVIIDGANVIAGTSPQQGALTIAGLLSLIRLLTKEGFEVAVVIQKKYMEIIPTGKSILQYLYNQQIVCDVPTCALDDLIALELARSTNGIVLSQDHFSDHSADDQKSYQKLVTKNTTMLSISRAPFHHYMTEDGHYIASHYFSFERYEDFFAKKSDPDHYELSTERRVKGAFDEKRKQKVLKLLDELIEELRVLEGPLQVNPTELKL